VVFSLEALQARKGDSLILHFGSKKSPKFAVIDGGPSRVYEDSLKPRLSQLSKKFATPGELSLAFAMVSHIDDDHIRGILDWLADWQKDNDSKCHIGDFWFNSFEDGLRHVPKELRAAYFGSNDPDMQVASLRRSGNKKISAVLASVGQGKQLRAFLEMKGIQVNRDQGLLIADGSATTGSFDGLTLTVVSPNKKRLQALFKKWQEAVKKKNKVEAAAYVDQSVENLSSLVVVAEFGEKTKKRMLLTGDARGDDILAGMKDGGFLDKNERVHVDLLKIPHHGSDRDVALEFFQRVTADYYVISANGENDNPDADTLCWLAEARGNDDYALYLTNESNPQKPILQNNLVLAFKKFPVLKKRTYFRKKEALSVCVDLEDKVTY
jgi:hypothetical protein